MEGGKKIVDEKGLFKKHFGLTSQPDHDYVLGGFGGLHVERGSSQSGQVARVKSRIDPLL